MMDKCIDYWKNRNHEHSVDDSTIWQRMCKHKQPVIEPRQSSNFPNAIEVLRSFISSHLNFELFISSDNSIPCDLQDYAAKLRDPSTSGAIFFAVCRGKVSEGLDFADRAGRAVIVTGMPFSTPTDPKVRLKREYLDKQAKPSNKNPKALTGEEWYVQQAARAVNQAVGRVIRHRHDYGAIIYCDERFVWPNYQSQMSYWLKPYIKCYSKYGEVVQTLTRFFRDKVCVDPKEMDSNDSVTPPADKCLPQEILSDSPATAVNEHQGTTVSLNATTRKNNYMKFTQITPANRTTLPMKHGCSTSSQLTSSRGQFSQDSQVVDLIDNATMHGQLKEHTLKSMRLKKAKIADVSSQLKHNVESRALTGNRGQQSTPPSKRSTIEQACEKNEAIQERCGGQESTTGPAFLKLAREKLSTAEYGEFVEFMKALKLKTMHIKDSLEAIAKLFSSPGRLTLLEGFRVFVSKNHLPLYEQLVRKYTMANT
uniref:ATP-dependent helicase C-terminal domain-containing protein n=1 Tax=Aegilops tauschii subsp. strangulata TaxID=200361 RepID=A0A453EZF8_AEGTS